MKIRWIIYIAIVAFLLLTPLVAMRFTNEVHWGTMDFLVMGFLLTGIAVILELAIRKRKEQALNPAYFVAIGLMLLAGFAELWVNGAVGIIGAEGNSTNLLFNGVVGVAAVGALFARFEPRGMMIAMSVTAAAQVLVYLIAPVAGWGTASILTFVFTLLWVVSALLFRLAAVATPQAN